MDKGVRIRLLGEFRNYRPNFWDFFRIWTVFSTEWISKSGLARACADRFSDDFLQRAEGLGPGKSGTAGQADGAGGVAGERPDRDFALAEGVGGEGGDQGGAVAGGDQVDEGFEGGGLHGALQAAPWQAVFRAAGGQGLIGEAVAIGENQQFAGECFLVDGVRLRKAMVEGQGGEQGLIKESDFGNFRRVGGGGKQGCVEAVVAQAVDERRGSGLPTARWSGPDRPARSGLRIRGIR